MERHVNYTLVGLFSLILVAGFVTFVLWAHHHGNDKPVTPYAVIFTQAVNGLSLGSTVRYLGVDVGQVQNIALETDTTPAHVRVTIAIDAKVPITKDTLATLKPSGITGVSFIDLNIDPANSAPLARTVDGMPIIRAELSGFDRLFDGASNSMQRLDRLLSDQNLKLINETFTNLDHISQHMDELLTRHDAAINRLMGPDMDSLAETIRSARKAMDAITALSDSLKNNPSQLIFPDKTKDVRIAP